MKSFALFVVAFLSTTHGMFLNRSTRTWALNGTRRGFTVPPKTSMGYVAQWNRLAQFTDLLTTESRLRSTEQLRKWILDCRSKIECSPDLDPEAKVVLMDILERTESDKLNIKLMNRAMNDYRTKSPKERRDILSRADPSFPSTIYSVATLQLMMDFEHIQDIFKIKTRLKSEFIDTFLKANQNQPMIKSLHNYLFWKAADPLLVEVSEEVEAMLMALNTFLDVTQEIREFNYSNPDIEIEAILFELSGQQLQQIPFKGY